ncbi:uncharacterized protein METZ01_LOCUS375219, partial [marine metagenome]
GGSDTCDDESACNTGDEGDCTYPDTNYDCDGNCTADVDCLGECGGSAVVDECDVCDGDGSSCSEPLDPAANLFFSEAAEGSSNNKYLEIYNGSGEDVALTNYAFANTSNAPSVPGEYEYFTTLANSTVAAGDVFVICHGSSDDLILAECDQTYTYLSNGDDGFCLIYGSPNADNTGFVGEFEILDCVGDWMADPGSGWDVAGVNDGTKDHTIVRKADVATGNGGDWTSSAGTNADDSEWIVFDQNTWDYLGSHPHDFSTDVLGCMDVEACNYNPDATVDDGTCATVDCAGECGGSAVCEVA